jgi:thiamine pyrophosphate-dependent acetolactate synthase large subunit-like protein
VGSYGVGRADLISGLRDAHQGGAPVLALAVHVPLEQEPDGVLHELHPARVFSGCSNYCGVVDDPSQASRITRTAMQHALVRGGVAVVLLESFVPAGSDALRPGGADWGAAELEHDEPRACRPEVI